MNKFMYVFILYSFVSKSNSDSNIEGDFIDKEILEIIARATEQIKAEAWSEIDTLIEELDREDWNDDEVCFKNVVDLLRSVKNNTLWAIWTWDSMQPPVATLYGSRYHLGNYDQCLQPPWSSSHPRLKTQYCLVDVTSKLYEGRQFNAYDNARWYLKTPTNLDRRLNERTIGVCLPATCDAASVAKISKLLFVHWNKSYLPKGIVTVDPRDCREAGKVEEDSMEYCTFWTTFQILLVVSIVSTFYNKVVIKCRCRHFDPIANTFCLQKNMSNLFKTGRNDIHVLYGIRTVTALAFVVLHEIFFLLMPYANTSNPVEIDQIFTTRFGRILLHTDVLVDTFFVMSGLLFVGGLLKRNYVPDIKMSLLKRYIRLIGPYAVATLYYVSSSKHAGDGPLWNRCLRMEMDHCDDFWWLNFLMINSDVDTMCNFMSWYVPCDFQLTVLGAGLFYLLQKNCKLGSAAFAMIICGVTLNLATVVYRHRLPMLPMQGLSVARDFKSHKSFNMVYIKSWHRAGPYFVGVLMAFTMAAYRPKDYRNKISKMHSSLLILGSLVIMGLVLSIGVIFSEYSPVQAALVVATNRTVWAMAICCIIGACEYGSASLVNYLLGWSGFVPLSKLTYSLYLVHPFIIRKRLYSKRNGVHFNFFDLVLNGAGTAVVSLFPVLLVYLLVEAPLANLTNLLFPEKKDIGENTEPESLKPGLEDLQYYYMPKQKTT